jgi:transketolase
MENNNEWHHNRLTKANFDLALSELGLSTEIPGV